jgi:hypothetical protein
MIWLPSAWIIVNVPILLSVTMLFEMPWPSKLPVNALRATELLLLGMSLDCLKNMWPVAVLLSTMSPVPSEKLMYSPTSLFAMVEFVIMAM